MADSPRCRQEAVQASGTALRSDTRQLLARWALRGLQLKRVGPFSSLCPDLSALGPEMAGLNRRWIRTTLARRRARNLLSFRRPEADGGHGRHGSVIRCSQDAVPDASARRCNFAAHA